MKRVCLGVGRRRCHRLIETNRRRCPDCQREENRRHNAARSPALRGLYGSSAWQRLRAQAVAAGRCHWCGATDVRLVGDHVISAFERPDLALKPENVVAACYSCNNARRRKQPLARGRR
jgi:5-methylcytosine-specific restriction endonuclease McrA